jgi:hypothetical protein
MKYLLMIWLNPTVMEAMTEEEQQAVIKAHDDFQALTRESGEFVGFAALTAAGEAAVVRVKDGTPTVTDGPYLESKEQFAGYYVVECETPGRAHELAALMPEAGWNGVEVRAVMNAGGMEM